MLLAGDGTFKGDYTVAFSSIDEDTYNFVRHLFKKICFKATTTKMYRSKKSFKSKKKCYEVRTHSKSFVKEIKKDLEELHKLKGVNLIKFVDGLFCSEGYVGKTIIRE